ncbi:MAG: radical SAM family heme chaperone HemW [Holosporales bacterium]|jgi:oxygen-independent coproporphyrinogen-3 oxidase|nr:radical SAM family heme chaperone HemW [Holosporales bacterium]
MSSIYIHWPFCLSKCYYCNFYSVPLDDNIDYSAWNLLYKNLILKFSEEFNEEITSIYFGGGTPSLLPCSFINDIIETINKNFKLLKNAEITVEANPKTIDDEKTKCLKASGVNRLSIGIQSLIDKDLEALGRIHNSFEAIECLEIAMKRFDNVSIDMIYNRPGQLLEDWERELEKALNLPIQHVSLYELIIEENTPIKKMIDSKKLPPLAEGSEFMEKTMEIAENCGFKQYEVSNFSKPGYEGKHNLSYWKYENYFGIGPSSHSRVMKNNQKIAIEQVSCNNSWIKWAKNPKFEEVILSEDDVFKEKLIFGLRSRVGINLNEISEFTKNKYNLQKKIETLSKSSYIIIDNDNITLTNEGLLRLNLVIEYVVRNS